VKLSRASWHDPSGLVGAAGLLLGSIAFGLITEEVAFGLSNPRRWVPDLLVGVALTGFGLFAFQLQRGVGALLMAAGLTWWLGNLVPAALYIHRGIMLHAVSTYRGWGTRTFVGTGLLALAYLFVSWPPLAGTDLGTALFGLGAVAVTSIRLQRRWGRSRRSRQVALKAAVALLVGSSGSVLIRISAGSSDAIEPSHLLYQVGLVAAAAILALGLRTPTSGSIADLVVEIGESRTSTVRDDMSKLLGDPLLQVGVRQADGRYVDSRGLPIDIPQEASPRIATWVGRGTPDDAVIVHDRSLLADDALLEAVRAVTRLSSAHAELTSRARQQLAELTAARRRLLTSQDEERRRLSKTLHDRTESSLMVVGDVLDSIVSNDGDATVRSAAERALEQLSVARGDLDTIARGLHPWESSSDLEAALAAIAERAPVPVSVDVAAMPERREVASVIYYLCSEAVANTLKHASADHIGIELMERGGALTVTVTDDGKGGAALSKGTGLEGLADRVAGLGGELVIHSPEGFGTRLTATFSVDGDA
jgi:signal transduction histidine kinase